jgi:methionine-rich copper-binding protein CopC
MRQTRHLVLAGLAAGAALLMAGAAAAHAHLVTSTPAANATVAAPTTISLTFNEKLTPAFSNFELSMPAMSGVKVPVKTTVSKDHLTIVGTPQAKLAPGAYTITWHAASADGHKMDGAVPFTVK